MNTRTLIELLMIILLIAMLVRLVLKMRKCKPKQKHLSLKVISQCKSCNKEWTSIFKTGDYLLKPSGKCGCGEALRIVKIYSEVETKKERKWREYTKKFEI